MASQRSTEIPALPFPDDISIYIFSFINNSSSIVRLVMSSKKLNRNIWFSLLKFPHKTTLGLTKNRLLFWTDFLGKSEQLTLAIRKFLTRKEVDFEAGLLATLVLAQFTGDEIYHSNLKAIQQLHLEKKLVSLCLEWLNSTNYLKKKELLKEIRAACKINYSSTAASSHSSSPIEVRKLELLAKVKILLDFREEIIARSTPLAQIHVYPTQFLALIPLWNQQLFFKAALNEIPDLVIKLMQDEDAPVREVACATLCLLLEKNPALIKTLNLEQLILKLVQDKDCYVCSEACKIIPWLLKEDSSLIEDITPVIMNLLQNNVHQESEEAYSVRKSALCCVFPVLLKVKSTLVEAAVSSVIPLLAKNREIWTVICPLLEVASKLDNFNKVIALFDTIELEKIAVSKISPIVLAKSLIALANQSKQLKSKVSKLLQQSNGKINLSVLDFPTIMELVKLSASQPEVSLDEKTPPAMVNG